MDNILDHTVLLLSRLQGIGTRSARRILFDLMKKKELLLEPLILSLDNVAKNIKTCQQCFNLDITDPCNICSDSTRDKQTICVVEDISSLWAIENSKSYNGLYFVLGGNISAQKNQSPQNLNIDLLLEHIKSSSITEVIIATSATMEGQITSHYIKDQIDPKITLTMLAQGIPIGGEIDYLDDITLSTAIKLRKVL